MHDLFALRKKDPHLSRLALDRVLRLAVVTPDFHRVHHSIMRQETDFNYGFNLSAWDRLFGTYVPQPSEGHEGMTIGLEAYRGEGPGRLTWCLMAPFRAVRSRWEDQ